MYNDLLFGDLENVRSNLTKMKKTIILLSLAFFTGGVGAQSSLDSLHTLVKDELKVSSADLGGQINSLSSELSASSSQQQAAMNDLQAKNALLEESLTALASELRRELNKEVTRLKRSLEVERNKTQSIKDSIASLKAQMLGDLTMMDSEVNELNTSLSATNEVLGDVKTTGEQVNKTTKERLTYLLAAICILLLLVIVVYVITNKNHGSARTELVDAKAHLEGQINSANADFAEKLAKTLSELPNLGVEKGSSQNPADNQGLILDFAQQIASMENNIWHLPEDDKVRKRIERATKKMRDTFMSLGYEMPKLLGTEIMDGQPLDIRNLSEDPDVEKGKRVIKAVAKPQVLLNGKTIQRPTVDIAENTED